MKRAAESWPVDPDPSAPPPGDVRLLLVDDDELVSSGFGRLLRNAGYDVTCAGGGRSALALAQEQRFDLVISDVSMPDLDGLSFLRIVKGHEPDMPVILITGQPGVGGAALAVEYGAFRYLMKPIPWPTLQTAVEHGVRASRQARALRTRALASREASIQVAKLALARAIDSLWMAYQPIVHADNGAVFAHEALMRPQEPTLPDPPAILAAAELTNRLPVLSRRIRELVAAVASTPAAPLLFVNLHPHDLLDETLFSPDGPLSASATRVVFELTERAPLDEIVDAVDRLARLRRMGFRIAIDDLGAGFAGLATLALIQPDFVKIDMSLVRNLDRDDRRRTIVRSLVTLCRELAIEVIAEGVETEGEKMALTACGCKLLQGYLFGRPSRNLVPFT